MGGRKNPASRVFFCLRQRFQSQPKKSHLMMAFHTLTMIEGSGVGSGHSQGSSPQSGQGCSVWHSQGSLPQTVQESAPESAGLPPK